MVSELFLSNALFIILFFNAGLILTILAWIVNDAKKIIFHLLSGIVFITLAVMQLSLSATFANPIMWTFFLFGFLNFIFMVGAVFEAYKEHSETSRWRYEE